MGCGCNATSALSPSAYPVPSSFGTPIDLKTTLLLVGGVVAVLYLLGGSKRKRR